MKGANDKGKGKGQWNNSRTSGISRRAKAKVTRIKASNSRGKAARGKAKVNGTSSRTSGASRRAKVTKAKANSSHGTRIHGSTKAKAMALCHRSPMQALRCLNIVRARAQPHPQSVAHHKFRARCAGLISQMVWFLT